MDESAKKNPLTLYREWFGPEPPGMFKLAAGFLNKGPEFFRDLQQAVDNNQPIDWPAYRKKLWGTGSALAVGEGLPLDTLASD